MVYRPMAFRKRRVAPLQKANIVGNDRRECMIKQRAYSKNLIIKRIGFTHLIMDRKWGDGIDDEVKLSPVKYFKKKWIYCNSMNHYQWRNFTQKVSRNLLFKLLELMMDDMVESQNRLTFDILKSGYKIANYQLGVFSYLGEVAIRRKLVFALIPYTKERVSSKIEPDFFPCIKYRSILQQKQEKGIIYEDLNLQRRLNTYRRLNGSYRRVSKRPEIKKTYIQSRSR